MSKIHSTAIIDIKADIASSVVIGPYSIIGPNVVIGDKTVIGSHTIIEGFTSIGSENKISHFASLGGAPQDMKYKDEPTRLLIGDRNTIREFTTIHTGTVQDEGITKLGNDNWIMGYVHIAHDCQIGDHTILSSNAQIAGHVVIGDWAILGAMSGVHQFVKIGQHAMLGGASVLVQDIPPYILAAGDKAQPYGINSEGLKRRGFTPESISTLKQLYKILYKDGLTLEHAKTSIRDILSERQNKSSYPPDALHSITQFLEFINSSTRGIIR